MAVVFFQIMLALHIWTVRLIENTSIFILFSWWLVCSSCYSALSLYPCFFLFVNLLLFLLWNYFFGTVFHFWCQEFLYFSSNVAHEKNIKAHPFFMCLFFKDVQSLLALNLTNHKFIKHYLLRGHYFKRLLRALKRNQTKIIAFVH